MPLSKIVAKSITDDTITTDQIADTSVHGRRNLIINPSGAVDQRGGSSTINTYSVDRWRSYGGPGGFTISQRTDAGEGDTHAIRFHRTSGNTQTNAMGIAQGLETVDSKRLAGKTLTVSFRARKGADWSPTNFSAIVYHGTGTDENPVSMTGQANIVAVSNASLTTSFQTFTGSVTIPSGKTQVTLGFSWTPSGTAGTNDYVDIREVQLEVGERATPFEHRSYGDELARCHRYYEKATGGNTAGMTCDATASVNYHVPFKHATEMRATPAYTWTEWTSSGFPATAPTFQQSGKNGVNVYKTCSITGSGRYWLGYVTADAEL